MKHMNVSKHIFVGIGVAAIATTLLSFSGEKPIKKGDDEKKKKYHVIHQENGEMHEYDTIIPMSSNYSVEDFLASKGIDDPEVKIIQIPSAANMAFVSKGDNKQVFVHQIDNELIIEDENGIHKEVKIIREENEDGEVIMKKFVNGEEVEVTDEDMKHTRIKHDNKGGSQLIFVQDGDDDLNWTPKEGDHNVEIKVEIDDAGNKTVQKFVNGEEVTVTEEEMEQMSTNGGNVFVFNTESGGDIDINLDSIMETIQLEVEMIDEEELKDGKQRVIIKEFRIDSETSDSDSKEIRKEVRMQQDVEVEGDEENFTVVLVHENYDESMEEQTQVHVQSNNNRITNNSNIAINAPISVYPNPNNGTFTIAFEQKDEIKTAIRVVDTQGKTVYKEKLGDFSGSYKKEVDLKKHGVGVYIVTVQQGDETSSRKVIVE
jgi:hypothetical protein